MQDIKSVLASEIRRLARKEVKAAFQPLREQISALKKSVSEQRAKIKTLEKRAPAAPRRKNEIIPVSEDKAVRISPQWIIRLRQKLGLTQEQFALLLGTSNFSVSHWELGKTTPRDAFKRKIAALRGMGKRELKHLLEEKDAAAATGKAKQPKRKTRGAKPGPKPKTAAATPSEKTESKPRRARGRRMAAAAPAPAPKRKARTEKKTAQTTAPAETNTTAAEQKK
jgi:DNA-binding transcriptional regulator YiaG